MDNTQDVRLRAEVWEALRQLSLGPGHFPVPERDADELVGLGLAEHVSGGYVITPAGRLALEQHYNESR
jgi:hypothetical protein